MNKPIDPLAKKGQTEPLTVSQLLACFVLWVSSLSLAIIVFIGENVWKPVGSDLGTISKENLCKHGDGKDEREGEIRTKQLLLI